uniref:RNA-directed DNA polymerase n=1 Tax=Bactrocera latifrons TaxID=174628 RepID=A0A0K8WBI5_BACLA
MLEQKIICHSTSPYSAPIWVVPKKLDASGKDKWRIVVDYRKLNNITVDDKYPIPNMDEILDKLGRCLYFTTIDLAQGFHQIEMDPIDRQKTAFSTQNGHFEFLRMPFGLKNAPATFQRLMNTVLDGLIGKDCMVYLDDIVVFNTSLQEHIDSLDKVFQRLAEANLKVQPDKSEFLKQETEFLGHVITPSGIKPNPNKVVALLNYPIPKTEKEIKQFLGLAGFYRKFIQNFSKITKPLTNCLKKGNIVNNSDKEFIRAVETIKLLITKEPILAYPNYQKLFTLTTDASNVALGAVLSQNGHPICFASRTLNEHELNYSATEKELLAMVWATKYFRPYLYGRKFLINSDHRPLQWLHNLKEPNAKLQRWKIRLNEYDFDIKYIPGKENHVADALSRVKIEACNVNEVTASNVATIHSADEDSGEFIRIAERPLNVFKNQLKLIRSNQNCTNTCKIFSNNLTTITYTELTTEFIKDIIKTYLLNKNTTILMTDDDDFMQLQNIYNRLITSNRFKIYRTMKELENIEDYSAFKSKVIEIHLEGLHQGIEKVSNCFKQKYYYPNYVKEITKIINECELCNHCKNDHISNKLPFKVTPPVYETREKFVVDFWKWDDENYLTCIDLYSKFAAAEKVSALNWLETKKALLKIFNFMGPPKTLKIDQDQGINNVSIKQWCQQLNIAVEVTTGKTGIGDIERFHKTMNEKLRIICGSGDKELKYLQIEQALFTYNHVISHSTTGESPYNIFFNRKHPKTNPQLIKERRINNINQNRQEKEIDTNFVSAETSRKRLDKISNPYKRVRLVQTESDGEHHVVKFKNRKVRKYKSQFKRRKKYV